MSKTIKKLLSISVASILLCSLFTIISLASTPPNASRWAYITDTQNKAYSSAVTGTYKVFGGDNYNTSKHNMTICSQYKDDNGDWTFDKKIRVGINQTLHDTNTTYMSKETDWRVYLKPYSLFQEGCNGKGYIWYDM